ncbi:MULTISPECIES: Rieske 2Fe-2S domain-containing protein [unclassified Beijerinckia]|uniref:Rieske 2Fe-2S domain-containing protein n=1 Tax=unclassified Beijerinckia TaxID=2638183 RepID=UPI00089D27FB|nr:MULTISPECIES: Rieske 2Fe-2S domain-containing protein [unclassified Beijerinckia]MDH7798311.1 5,5'-dehydrodivanillate O-demethylase [Beijerinckia sp. GAS462]SED16609.1 5,5'-dehydrodivanillate O-demethylase [Beijerinckia sp. 28-YEA-48]
MGVGTMQLRSKSMDYASAGPDTMGGRFLRKFWQPVYMSNSLAKGTARPILIMGEKFTLYRGESGTAFVVDQRCAHRSTQLSTGWVRGDNIRCFYHGWTFDGRGACVERPGEVPSGAAPGVRIKAYPTQEHMGLIYAYFGEGEPPAFPPFPEFEGEGVVENMMEEFPCNWFQTYENQADEAHLSFVHSPSGSHNALGRDQIKIPESSAEEMPFGMVRYSRVGEGKRRSTLYLFPNTMRIIIPPFGGLPIGGWRDSYLTLVPTSDESHILFMTQFARVAAADKAAYAEAAAKNDQNIKAARKLADIARDILDGKAVLEDFRDHPRFLLIEDAVAQGGQGWIVDRSQEHLGRTDICIVRMRRLFDRELNAIAEGEATKDFRYSGEPPELGF